MIDRSVGSRLRGVGPVFRLDLENPYLRLQNLTLFVRDQDRSLRFFVDLLGFSLIADRRVPDENSWVVVAPPDGRAILALMTPKPTQEEYRHIGRRQIVLMTEDVDAIYQLWLERGVSFKNLPKPAPAGVAIFTIVRRPKWQLFRARGI